MATVRLNRAGSSSFSGTTTGSSQEKMHYLISKKAQEIYEKSGRIPGRDLANWLEAERMVKKGI